MGYNVLDFRRRRASGAFSPARLFASGEEGAWYDPSDLSTLFQDSLGTTPVTTAGQPVGLMLDKSQGLTLGAQAITNGTFATATDWTLTTGAAISGGQLEFSPGSTGEARQSLTLDAGKTYIITFDIVRRAGAISVRLLGGTTNNFTTVGATGSYAYHVVPNAGNNELIIVATNTSVDADIDNISVREIPGNHATQATSAARPTYQYEWDGVGPLGDELVTNGDGNSIIGWSSGNSANLSSVSGRLRVTNNGAGFGNASQSFTTVVGDTYKITVSAFAGSSASQRWRIGTSVGGSSIYDSGSEASDINYSFTFIATATETYVTFYANTSNTTAYAEYDNISVKDIPVGSRLHFLAFDGVDDSMLTGTITPGVDKAQVFAGVRGLRSATSLIVEFSSNTNDNNGSFTTYRAGPAGWGHNSRGTSPDVLSVSSGFVAPTTNVLTGIGDISGPLTRISADGNVLASSTGSQGTGNFLTYPLYIGARAGTSLYFNGNMYGLITRFGPNLTDAQIADTEAYVATKTGVTL